MEPLTAYRQGAFFIILSLMGLQSIRFWLIEGDLLSINNEIIIRENAGWPHILMALVFVVLFSMGIGWFIKGKEKKDPLEIKNVPISELRSRRNTLLILTVGFLLLTIQAIFLLTMNINSQVISTSTEFVSALFATLELYTAIGFFIFGCFVAHKAGRKWGKLNERIEKDPAGVEE